MSLYRALSHIKEEETLSSKHDSGKCRVSFSYTGRFTPVVKTRQYRLNMRLVGRQNRPENCGEEKNLLLFPSIKPRSLGRPVHRVVIIPTYIIWLVQCLTLERTECLFCVHQEISSLNIRAVNVNSNQVAEKI